MYEWIHSEFDISDHEIAKRMLQLGHNNWESDLGIYKGWLSHLKNGNIATTNGYNVWLLAKVFAELEQKKEFSGDNEDASEHYERSLKQHHQEILFKIATKLHAVFTTDFLLTGARNKKKNPPKGRTRNENKNLKIVGCDYFSYLNISKKEKHYQYLNFEEFGFSPFSFLDAKDITIDILEKVSYGLSGLESDDINKALVNIEECIEHNSGLENNDVTQAVESMLCDPLFLRPATRLSVKFEGSIRIATLYLAIWLLKSNYKGNPISKKKK